MRFSPICIVPVSVSVSVSVRVLGLVLQLISDISYHLIDPRIDFEGR